MNPLPALALVMSLFAAPGSLEAARTAFEQGRYAEAEQLALDSASPPHRGAALYLAGLARFRDGRQAQALEALDEAGRAEDPPDAPMWQFNRAACLYTLGRFPEAEEAYLAAAREPSLAAVALANAGFAALDAGFPERAREWALKARATASGGAQALVDDLLAQLDAPAPAREQQPTPEEHRQALKLFDSGRYAPARALFLEVVEGDAHFGPAWLMAGACSYFLGERTPARVQLERSLREPLSAEERRVALDYLDRLSFGLRAAGRGFSFWADAAAGWDSNVLQVGIAARDLIQQGSTASPFAEAGLSGVYRVALGERWFAELSYLGNQRAYFHSSAEDYSLQQHRLTARLEVEPLRHFRLGLSLGGEALFTGLTSFRPLQFSGIESLWLALDESELTSTRLALTLAHKAGASGEFEYLTGLSPDVTLSQAVRFSRVSLTAWLRYREDRIGTLTQTRSSLNAPELCPLGCSAEYVIPLSWRGQGAGASLRLPLITSRLELSADAAVEVRSYVDPSFVRARTSAASAFTLNSRERQDFRVLGDVTLEARLLSWLVVSLRYDLVAVRSNVDTRLADEAGVCSAPSYSCHRFDYANQNFLRHLVTLGLGASW